MKRLTFDSKKCTFVWSDWKPFITEDFGDSCVKKSKYVEDKIRINNNEVSTGSNRMALYTMPGGVDNGIRYSSLYESSGLDITEIEANKAILSRAKSEVEDKIKDEFEKISTDTANKLSMSKSKESTSFSSSTSSE